MLTFFWALNKRLNLVWLYFNILIFYFRRVWPKFILVYAASSLNRNHAMIFNLYQFGQLGKREYSPLKDIWPPLPIFKKYPLFSIFTENGNFCVFIVKIIKKNLPRFLKCIFTPLSNIFEDCYWSNRTGTVVAWIPYPPLPPTLKRKGRPAKHCLSRRCAMIEIKGPSESVVLRTLSSLSVPGFFVEKMACLKGVHYRIFDSYDRR